MAKTCTACRSRKMRCDGVLPSCGPCSRARKPIDCTYVDTSLVQEGPKPALLQKGAACLACRRKKKRCDAQRPSCHTCTVAGKEFECLYDDDVQQDMTTALLLRNTELEQRLALLESQSQDTPPSLIESSSPTSSSGDWFNSSGVFPPLFADKNDLSLSPAISDVFPDSLLNPPIINFDPSIFFAGQSIYPTNPTPLDDTLLTSPFHNTHELRSTFLAHSSCIGFYLRPSKWQAIRQGDYSGAVIHPSMVHLALLIGGICWSIHRKDQPLAINEELELQRALNSLHKPPAPVSLIVIYCLIAWFYFFRRRIPEGQSYLAKAHQVVVQFQINLSSEDMESILEINEPSEDTKEMVTALCELAYLDKAATLVLKTPTLLHPEINRQLRQLPILQPWLSKHSVVVLRCRSAYFLQEALRISRMRAESTPEHLARTRDFKALPEDWYEQYWETLREVGQHVAALTTQMLKSSLCTDARQAVTLKVCLMVALAAQLELHRLPGFYHPESRQKVVDTVCEIVGLTKGIKDEDSSLLDPILGECWTIVAAALRQEKQAFVDMSSLTPDGQWGQAFSVMITCAAKVGTRLPYLENALHALREVAARGPQLPLATMQ